ncbi:MAG: phosphoribosylglycinamide formyltransferase [Pseudomonadota bacterium]
MTASVVVLISGRGSNLDALFQAEAASSFRIDAVFSNRDAAGLSYAHARGRPGTVIARQRGEDRERYDQRLRLAIDPLAPDIVVLAGFMRILSAPFVAHYAGRLLNIHPSLLPAYRGLDVHERVLAAGEARSGASVHFVTADLDAGPVLIQGVVPVLAGDTPATLSARVQRAEHTIYPAAVELVAAGRVVLADTAVAIDGAPQAQPFTAFFDEDGGLLEWPDTLPRCSSV